MEITEKEVSPILKKHVNTIHCSNNLTLVQRKLFNVLLFHAYHELPEKSQYEIPVKKLCQLIGYDSRDYKKLKKSIMDLIVTAIEWNVMAQENGEHQEKWRSSAIVSAAKIENGICTYEFSSVMRELLYRPEIYGKIDIGIMIEFKSSYGLALYENCVRFQGISSTPWLPIKVFRKLMGVPDSSYLKYCDLKKRVVDVAVNEVNQYSPIKVIPELKRVNNKVTSIKFKLSKTHENSLPSEQESINEGSDLIAIMEREMGLSSELAREVILKYGAQYVDEKIKLIKNSDSYKSGRIREISAYFMDALKRDYKPGKSSAAVINKERKDKEAQARKEKQYLEDIRRETAETTRKVVDDYFNNLKSEEQNYIMLKFEKHLKENDGFYAFKKYKEMGLDNRVVRSLFDLYVKELANMDQEKSKTFA